MAATLRVRHIGKHAKRADTMTGTGTVWHGFGDIQTVPAKDWETLKKYPDLWELAGEEPEAVAQGAGLADAFDLDTATDDQIRAWLADKPFKVHHKKTGEALRAAVREALAA